MSVRLPPRRRRRPADPHLDRLRCLDGDARGRRRWRPARRACRSRRTAAPHGLRTPRRGRPKPCLLPSRLPWSQHQIDPILRGRQFVSTGGEDASSAGGVDELTVLVVGRRSTDPTGLRWRLRGQRGSALRASAGGGRRRVAFRRRPAVRRHHLIRRRVVRPRRRRSVVVRRHRQRERRVRRGSRPGRHAGRQLHRPAAPGRSRPAAGCTGTCWAARCSADRSTGVSIRHGRSAPRVAADRHVALRVAAELNRGRPLAGELLARVVARATHHGRIVLRRLAVQVGRQLAQRGVGGRADLRRRDEARRARRRVAEVDLEVQLAALVGGQRRRRR